MAILKVLYDNYPVYFGDKTVRATEEEIEDGSPETRKVSWVTAAPAGETNTRKADRVDVAALLGKNIAGMPPAEGKAPKAPKVGA